MARIWRELGFAVDAIHWTNGEFRPAAPYDVLIDPRRNLERLAPLASGLHEDAQIVQVLALSHEFVERFRSEQAVEALVFVERPSGHDAGGRVVAGGGFGFSLSTHGQTSARYFLRGRSRL